MRCNFLFGKIINFLKMDLGSSVLENYKRDSGEDSIAATDVSTLFTDQERKLAHIRAKKG
jgi:hypothetical protein